MSKTLLFTGTEWRGYDAPEKPDYCTIFTNKYPCDGNGSEEACKAGYCLCWERMETIEEMTEQAQSSALVVVNPELLRESVFDYSMSLNGNWYNAAGNKLLDGTFPLPDNLDWEVLTQVYYVHRDGEDGWYDENEHMSKTNERRQVLRLFLKEQKPSECPKCRTKDFDSCHSMHCPVRDPVADQPVESQSDLWDEVDSSYISWPYQTLNVKDLLKHFTLTRKQP
jgi:hypothetical protein